MLSATTVGTLFIVHAIHATRRSKSQPFSLVKQVVDALEPASLVLKVAAFAQLREFAPTPWDLHPNLFLIRSAASALSLGEKTFVSPPPPMSASVSCSTLGRSST